MLKRIQKIQNVGKFLSCHPPSCEFGKETVIFGFNAQGKSTLTSIFRSLMSGNGDVLIGRKTFGITSDQLVELDFEESAGLKKVIFQNGKWNNSVKNILIFDTKFISENIFDGESITFDQQKNLNSVIIGKEGRDLGEQIAALQFQSDEFTRQKKEKTFEYKRSFPDYDFVRFLALKPSDLIDEDIRQKEEEIRFENEKESIKQTVKAYIELLSKFDFSIRDVLSKTLDVKQKEIELHIKRHFQREDNALSFLEQGLNYLKTKLSDSELRECVFCSQVLGVDAERLIEVYSSYFKAGYQELQKELRVASNIFKGFNVEAILEKLLVDLSSKILVTFLKKEEIVQAIKDKSSFEEELIKKEDLNYSINFASFENLKSLIEKVKKGLVDFERDRLSSPSLKDKIILKNEKRILEIRKLRFEPRWIEFCRDFSDIETKAELLRTTRDKLREALDIYSENIFKIHKSKINEICKTLGAAFEIEDFNPIKKVVGRTERIFAIKFFGAHRIKIDDFSERVPNFRNTLSESDKRLLAFAFFVSLLEYDKDLGEKIVIFDDPMSSFDNERRRKTLHLILDISYNDAESSQKIFPKQKIILTHDDRFARECMSFMPEARSLRFKEQTIEGRNWSELRISDFHEELPEDDLFSGLVKLKYAFDGKDAYSGFELDCRKVLENILKRKYYFQLKTDIAARKSVTTYINTLKEGAINGFDNLEKFTKFSRLCLDLNIDMHDGASEKSNGDKLSILQDFFDCLTII